MPLISKLCKKWPVVRISDGIQNLESQSQLLIASLKSGNPVFGLIIILIHHVSADLIALFRELFIHGKAMVPYVHLSTYFRKAFGTMNGMLRHSLDTLEGE